LRSIRQVGESDKAIVLIKLSIALVYLLCSIYYYYIIINRIICNNNNNNNNIIIIINININTLPYSCVNFVDKNAANKMHTQII